MRVLERAGRRAGGHDELYVRLVNGQGCRHGEEDALRWLPAQLPLGQRVNTLRLTHAAVMRCSAKSPRQVAA